MKLRNQTLENKATSDYLVEVNVDVNSEKNENGVTSWKVESYVIQTNAYPQTNDEPEYKTLESFGGLEIVVFENSNNYVMREV